MLRLLVLTASLLLTAGLPASAKTAKDCEAIKNPMEFNLCLASLSPVRGSRAARAARRGSPEATVPQGVGNGRSARATRSAPEPAPRVKLPEGALKLVNGRVRLAITPR